MTNEIVREDDALAATLEYFKGDELAASVWLSKYALRNIDGALVERTPSDMHRRLAREFARIEGNYPNPMSEQEIYELLEDWTVVPQGSPMAGIGNQFQLQSLSNCFVIEPCQDSFGSILRTDEEQCQIMKRRGGVGHDISKIRPRGAYTNNAAKTTDGISAFMERFSTSCRTTAQGGRRGALMLTIACNHPEIHTFIDIKRDRTKVTGANISIRVTDDFMKAVEEDSSFTLQWPVDVPVNEAKVVQTVKAREIWHKIVAGAHDSAEPGVLFWDNIINLSPADSYLEFRSSSTNPCGEIPLSPLDSCRLLLINLNNFVLNRFTPDAKFDTERFMNVAMKAQRLMDDLVDLEIECIDKIIRKIESDPENVDLKRVELELWQGIKTAAVRGRRTGLGITGLGDMIAGLNRVYGSLESVHLTEIVYKNLAMAAYSSTIKLAQERGAFPAYDYKTEHEHPFIKRILDAAPGLRGQYKKFGRRNIALTTTAPAGSVSILTQTTSGIEPVFMLSYTRRKKINPNDKDARVDFIDALGDKWQHFEVYHHGLQQWLDQNPGKSIEQSPYFKATSADIDAMTRVTIQAQAQHWICHSISSTINLPKDTTVETVKKIYMAAWHQGLKGVTVYRDGSRDGVLVQTEPKKEDSTAIESIQEVHAPKRPHKLPCDIHRVTIKGESYVVFVGLLDGKPYEVFAGLTDKIDFPKKCSKGVIVKNGKKDGLATYNIEIPFGDEHLVFKDIVNLFDNNVHGAFTRMISLSLRHGIPPKFISEQIRKDRHSDMTSFSSVLARTLSKNYILDGTKATSEKTCSECKQETMTYQGGCLLCTNCGNSKC